jgi:hypothetical protein
LQQLKLLLDQDCAQRFHYGADAAAFVTFGLPPISQALMFRSPHLSLQRISPLAMFQHHTICFPSKRS